MVLRLGWLVLALWAGCGNWMVGANDTRCDVEALRCDVICSFPDLTMHCNRCVRRRPMRFGKRSGREPPSSPVGANEVMVVARDTSAFPRPPLLRTRATSPPEVRLPISSHGLPERDLQGEEAAAPESWNRAPLQRKFYPDYVLTRDPPNRVLEDFEVDTSEGEFRRRRRRSVSEVLPIVPRSSRLATSSDDFPRGRKKRSTVYEIIEGLMELLGLETLPVDPRFYGCHELVLPFYN